MKKLLLSSIVLLLFSFSILLFQVSCQKEANANTNNTTTTQNKILFVKSQTGQPREIWTANIDGTNQQKVNITIPSGKTIDDETVEITADGSKIVLVLWNNATPSTGDIYTCNIDGSDLTKIIGNTTAGTEYTSVKYY